MVNDEAVKMKYELISSTRPNGLYENIQFSLGFTRLLSTEYVLVFNVTFQRSLNANPKLKITDEEIHTTEIAP